MNAEQTAANAYTRTRVLTAPPEELRLMLLDGAIKFARQGLAGLEAKNYEASYNGISQCRNIIVELLSSMRPEHDPELCDRVRSVYTFIYTELISASMDRDPGRLTRTIELIEFERQTWAMLLEQLSQERGGAPKTSTPPTDLPRPPLSVQA